MQTKEVKVFTEMGLRARVATIFVSKANEFKPTNVIIRYNERQINGQSLLGVLSASITYGATIKLITDGPKEVDAMRTLVELIACGFRDY